MSRRRSRCLCFFYRPSTSFDQAAFIQCELNYVEVLGVWKINTTYKVAYIVKLTCAKLQQNPGTKVKTSDLAHQSVSLFSLWESSLMLSDCAELPATSPVSHLLPSFR